MAFPWQAVATGAQVGASLLNNGGGQQKQVSTPYLVAPEYRQGMLDYWTNMMRGGGDFLAPELRTGQATIGAMLANRGIAPNSPLAGQLMANMGSQAINTANQNRFGQMIQMYGTAPATTEQKGFGSWLDNEGSPNLGTWTATGWEPKPGANTSDSWRNGPSLGSRMNRTSYGMNSQPLGSRMNRMRSGGRSF